MKGKKISSSNKNQCNHTNLPFAISAVEMSTLLDEVLVIVVGKPKKVLIGHYILSVTVLL
jgi:hypothetical protein